MRVINGVAVIGESHHAQWCPEEGLEHDHWFCSEIEKIIHRRSVKRMVIAGSHIGTTCSRPLRLGVRVNAFDANPEACAALLHNLGHHETLTVENVALGDRAGLVNLQVDADNAGATYVTASALSPGIDVPMMRLDDFNLSPDFVLADIEGSEPKLLRGATQTIARSRPVMVLEVNEAALRRVDESPAMLFFLLEKLGYDWKVMQYDLGKSAPQFDVLCCPR